MILTRRNLLKSAGLAATSLVFGSGRSIAKQRTIRLGGRAFGSTWTVVLDENHNTISLFSKIRNVLVDIDNCMSPYTPKSEISRFNAMPSGTSFRVSSSFEKVSRAALEMAKFTDGAFDPTVGPKVNQFGFGPIIGSKNVDWQSVSWDQSGLQKIKSGATFDLCGIAKGYALDKVQEVLINNHIDNAFIEIGGEIATIGHHPTDRPWRAAIESPMAGSKQAICIVEPGSLCLATSGLRANGLVGSIQTSHIIGTEQISSRDGQTLSVSVLAKSGMLADALATALCAMESRSAVGFAEENQISALFAISDNTSFRTVATGTFDHQIVG